MKIVHPKIESIFYIDKGYVNELIVENQKLFSCLVGDIVIQIEGKTGETVLSIKDCPVNISSNCEILFNFTPFEVNKKSLLTKLYSHLEKESVNDVNYLSTMEFLNGVEKFIETLTFNEQCDFCCEKLSAGTIFKAVGLKIDCGDLSDIEKIYEYINLVCSFDSNKLFIMVNMRSYFSDEQMELFLETILTHQNRVLLLECKERNHLKNVKRCIIDEDLCEF